MNTQCSEYASYMNCRRYLMGMMASYFDLKQNSMAVAVVQPMNWSNCCLNLVAAEVAAVATRWN